MVASGRVEIVPPDRTIFVDVGMPTHLFKYVDYVIKSSEMLDPVIWPNIFIVGSPSKLNILDRPHLGWVSECNDYSIKAFGHPVYPSLSPKTPKPSTTAPGQTPMTKPSTPTPVQTPMTKPSTQTPVQTPMTKPSTTAPVQTPAQAPDSDQSPPYQYRRPRRGHRLDSQRTTLPNDIDERFDQLLLLLRLPQEFPDNLDRDLVKFALYGDGLYDQELCRVDSDLLSRLETKYQIKTCDNRILETYGDKALDLIITQWIADHYQLDLTVQNFESLLMHTVSNFDLGAISLEMGLC